MPSTGYFPMYQLHCHDAIDMIYFLSYFDFVNDHQMTSCRALLHVPHRNLLSSAASEVFHLILGNISPRFSRLCMRVMLMRKMMTMKMKNMTMMMAKNMTMKMMAKLTPCRASLKHLPSSSPPRHSAGLWEPTFSFWSRLCDELS